ncbi:MAG: PadR family transcriptional regulator [Clostridia bacterium]|nr:PadR family transcriptional regulator [Clostridia bacterium]
MDKELLKGSTGILLLSLLSEGPMYGYQMVKELEQRSEGIFRFKEGTLYPALHRLEAEGLIEGRWEKRENGPDRKYYYLTSKGGQALAERAKEWGVFRRAVERVIGSGLMLQGQQEGV